MKYALTLVGGLVLGVLVTLFMVGAPRAKKMPGEPVKPPEAGGPPPATAIVTLDQQFFNTVLGTIFRDMNAPSFPLQLTSFDGLDSQREMGPFRHAALQDNPCPDRVTAVAEGSNTQTRVQFAGGKIMAPIAFTGSYSILGSCLNFKGWAQTELRLRFAPENQTVYGEIVVEGVDLEGVPAGISGVITTLVQASLNRSVNPIEILRGQQLALSIPVQASGGLLRAQIKDVRAEIKENSINLFVTYDFTGQRGGGGPAPPAPAPPQG